MARIKLHNPVIAENSFLENAVVETLANDPTFSGVTGKGRIWYNSTDKKLKGAYVDGAGTAIEVKDLADGADITTINNSISALESNIDGDIGDVASLTTTASTVVGAINEVSGDVSTEEAARIAADSALDTAKVDKIDITGATVGSSTAIPVVTYNAQGQITSTTTASIDITLDGVTTLGNTTTNDISVGGVTGTSLTTAGLTSTATLSVSSTSTFTGVVTANGDLDVNGDVTVADFSVDAPVSVNAGSFVAGQSYVITATGDTDFTAIGAANSNPGTVFTATGAGAGTGTANTVVVVDVGGNRIRSVATPVVGTDAVTKAYADSLVSSSAFTISDGTNSSSVVTDDTITFSGTAGEVEVAVGNGVDTVTIGLPDNVDIDGTFDVAGATTLTGALTANGGVGTTTLTTSSTITSTGALTANGGLTSTTINATGAVDFDTTLNVDGNTTLGGTLGVTGATTLTGALTANGGVGTTNLTTSGTADVGTDLTVTGTSALEGATTVGTAGVNANLTVNGGATTSGDLGVGGNATITGNLTVQGTTTTVNSEQLTIADNVITLNAGIGAVAPTQNSGIEVDRGNDGTLGFLTWNETTDTVQIAEWNGVDAFVQVDVATATDSAALQTEVDATQTSLGFTDSAYSNSGTYIAGSNVTADIGLLDTDLARVETGVGVWGNLTTTSKVVVGAVNELDAEIGDISTFSTTAKATVVAAVNELDSDIGVLTSLTTTAKGSAVAAINELDGEVGVLTSLTTTAQGTIIAAINEVDANADTNASGLATEITDRGNADAAIQAELDNTQTGAGLGTGGAYTTLETSNYMKAADFTAATLSQSLFNAAVLLDTKLKSVADATDGNIGDLGTLTTTAKDTLVAAINEVDANADTNASGLATEITDRGNADAAIQSELDATQTGAGLGTDGSYTANAGMNYIDTSTSLVDADEDLDTALKAEADRATAAEGANATAITAEETRAIGVEGTLASLTTTAKTNLVAAINEVDADLGTEVTNRTTADNTLQSNIDSEASTRGAADTALQGELDATQTGAGLGTGGAYTANAGTNYLGSATSLVSADEALDTQIKSTIDTYAATTGTSDGSGLIGYKGYTESNVDITVPTVEITAGTIEAAINDICSSVNEKIYDMENKWVKGEIADVDKSDVYTIAHNLNTTFVDVSVQVYDTVDTTWRFDLVVTEVIDANTVKVSLAGGISQQIRYVIQGF